MKGSTLTLDCVDLRDGSTFQASIPLADITITESVIGDLTRVRATKGRRWIVKGKKEDIDKLIQKQKEKTEK